MTQTHKIRPSADRLVEWSAEEMQRMRAVMRSCLGFIESRYPGEQPCYEDTLSQPMRYANRWYYDNAPAQQEEPNTDTPRVKLDEHIDEIRKMCADPGCRTEDISERFGVTAETLRKFARKNDIKVTRYNPAMRVMLDNRQAIQLWLKHGIKQRQIAEQLHVNADALSRFVKKYKLTPKKSKLKK